MLIGWAPGNSNARAEVVLVRIVRVLAAPADIADGAGSAAWTEIMQNAAAARARANKEFTYEDMFPGRIRTERVVCAALIRLAKLGSGLAASCARLDKGR